MAVSKGTMPKSRPTPGAAAMISLSQLVNDPEALVGSADVVRLRLAPTYKTLLRWVREDKFPRPLQLGRHYLTWRGKTLLAWLDRREKESLAALERPGQARTRRMRMREQQETNAFRGDPQ
jgi:predicted DNA-binding transcriptional regulator AlpA